jgi:hypothetical protein
MSDEPKQEYIDWEEVARLAKVFSDTAQAALDSSGARLCLGMGWENLKKALEGESPPPAVDDRGKTIKYLQDQLHRKNIQLDAMDWVWCSGGCEGGIHRYNDLPDLTEEMVLIAEENTKRLRRWYETRKFQDEYKKRSNQSNAAAYQP